jgi:outer membrane protein TolC
LRKLSLAIILAAGVAACTTTPTAPPALDLPMASANDPAFERWWLAFGDPTLTALIDEALANNLNLAAAVARVDAARAQYKIVAFDQSPELDVVANAGRTRQTALGSFPLPPASQIGRASCRERV